MLQLCCEEKCNVPYPTMYEGPHSEAVALKRQIPEQLPMMPVSMATLQSVGE